jgi:plasmid stabilization system protein ParE
VTEFKLTRKASADLEGLLDFSRERFGIKGALQLLGELEHRIQALARHDFDGPALHIASRDRLVRRWPVPPYWIYYDRVGGVLRILRIYHGAREPL